MFEMHGKFDRIDVHNVAIELNSNNSVVEELKTHGMFDIVDACKIVISEVQQFSIRN